jgi:hypothetical protein
MRIWYNVNGFLHETNEWFGILTAVLHVQMLGSCILYDYVTVKDGNANKKFKLTL